MPAGYDELTPGHEFPPVEYRLTADMVAAYIEAVEATNRTHVPPLAVAAHAIGALAELVAFPPGTIHASQEFQFAKLVPVDTKVTCAAKVHRKLARGPMRMLTLDMEISDESGTLVQHGRSTVILPE
ncbi:MAG: hypothetical protein JW846_00730 [Dehalococcoidia bacterium]|nr:hypothetical protein [Dehalococcoidia bacterium]